MRELLRVTRALGDANRVRALLALEKQELCLCQLVEMLGLAASTVSKHMAVLRHADLVESRKSGRWVYYRGVGGAAPRRVTEIVEWTRRSLARDPRIARDRVALRKILRRIPSESCQALRPAAARRSRSALSRA